MIAPAQGLEALLASLEGVKSAGADKWTTKCSAHEDRNASLSITEVDVKVLLKCHAGCETAAVVAAAGLSMADLFPPREVNGSGRHIDKTYDYRDADGTLIRQVVKFFPKDFRQRKPDGRGGWEPSVKGCKPIPYRLFELTREDPGADIFIPEGEKDVERL